MRLNFRSASAFASKKAKEYLQGKNPEDIKNIAVIRHAAIGDFMNIRPFLIGMREFFPNAKITLSVNSSAVYGLPQDLVDEIHVMDKVCPKDKSKKTGLFYRIRQAKTLKQQDIIFDLTDSTLSLWITFLSGAKLKVGYPYRSIRRYFYDMATLRSEYVLEADSVQHMLNMLGYKNNAPLRYGFEEKYPKNVVNQIVYFAGASANFKCWEQEKFKSLIEKLSDRYPSDKHIILQGVNASEKFLDLYESLKERTNVLLQKAMPLDEAMQFLSNSKCVIANDTGLRNMAIAVETPTVGIFFMTGAFRYWPRDGKHDCVFNPDHTSPNIESVYLSTVALIDKIYAK